MQSIKILKGDAQIAPDFYDLLLETAAQMLLISGKAKDVKKAKRKVTKEAKTAAKIAAKYKKEVEKANK